MPSRMPPATARSPSRASSRVGNSRGHNPRSKTGRAKGPTQRMPRGRAVSKVVASPRSPESERTKPSNSRASPRRSWRKGGRQGSAKSVGSPTTSGLTATPRPLSPPGLLLAPRGAVMGVTRARARRRQRLRRLRLSQSRRQQWHLAG